MTLHGWRRLSQVVSLFLLNCGLGANLAVRGLCFPVLNCWACPVASTSCPVGVIGGLLSAPLRLFPTLFLGITFVVGALGGRILCGWACPFGFFQEMLHRLAPKRLRRAPPQVLGYGKFAVFVLMVVVAALVWDNKSTLFFCALCPAGTLEAAIPAKVPTASGIELLTSVKLWILLAVVLACVFVSRFFCHVLCPVGAFMAPFNRVSFLGRRRSAEACVGCGLCGRHCPLGVRASDLRSEDCVNCFECVTACRKGAIGVLGEPAPKRREDGPAAEA